jgi:hypothetical protein
MSLQIMHRYDGLKNRNIPRRLLRYPHVFPSYRFPIQLLL